MRVPTKDYSSVANALQTKGNAATAAIQVKANRQTLNKFELNQKGIKLAEKYGKQQMTYQWANFGLSVADTLLKTGTQIYNDVQQTRRTKAVNDGITKLDELNREEVANNGWTLIDDPKDPGKKMWHEDPEYETKRNDYLDGLQDAYGLDDASNETVRSTLLEFVRGKQTSVQTQILNNWQTQDASERQTQISDMTSEYVANHADSILEDDWTGSEALQSLYARNPYIVDKDQAWEQAQSGMKTMARKQVLQNIVDTQGSTAAYDTLKSWNLEAGADNSMRKVISDRKTSHKAEVSDTVTSGAQQLKEAIASGEEGASWSSGWDQLQDMYADRSSDDKKTARDAFLDVWKEEANTAVQEAVSRTEDMTSKEIGEEYDKLAGSEMFRSMPADERNTIMAPLQTAQTKEAEIESKLRDKVSEAALKTVKTQVDAYVNQWNGMDIDDRELVDDVNSLREIAVGENSALTLKDQAELESYIYEKIGTKVSKGIPSDLKDDWDKGWSMIDQSIQDFLGIKDIEKVAANNPELYQRYKAFCDDSRTQMLAWARRGKDGQRYDRVGFLEMVDSIQKGFGSYLIAASNNSGTREGLATGGLQTGMDYGRLLGDLQSTRTVKGTIRSKDEKLDATYGQLYADTAKRLDGVTVVTYSDDNGYTEKGTLDISTDGENPPMYASSPAGTLQAFIDKKSGEVYAVDKEGFIYRTEKQSRKYGDEEYVEYVMVPGSVGMFDVATPYGKFESPKGTDDDDGTDGTDGTDGVDNVDDAKKAFSEAISVVSGRKDLDKYTNKTLDALYKAIEDGSVARQGRVILQLRGSDDSDIKKLVNAWYAAYGGMR